MVSMNFSSPSLIRSSSGRSLPLKTQGVNDYRPSLMHAPKADMVSLRFQGSQSGKIQVTEIPADYGQEIAKKLTEQSFDSPHALALYWTTQDFVLDMSGAFRNAANKQKLEDNPDDNKLAERILQDLKIQYKTE